MNFKYWLGAFLTFPLLPVMYFQGKKIRAKVPKLPEAKGCEGRTTLGVKPELRLITIGESTIAGVGVDSHEKGFTGTLASELSRQTGKLISWKVYAKSGYTAKKVSEEIVSTIEEDKVDLIVIGLGGNDAFQFNKPSRWRADIEGLIAKLQCKYKNTPIVFTNMPPIKTFPAFTPLIKFTIGNLVEILGEELNDLLKDHENVYYNDRIITQNDWINRLNVHAEPADFFSDGVHPSELTYQVWAKDFADFLLNQNGLKPFLSLQKI